MTAMILRLLEDRLPAGGDPVYLPQARRAIYVAAGHVTVEFPDGCTHVAAESAWLGEGEIAYLPAEDARLLRFELVSSLAEDTGQLRAAPAAASAVKLSMDIDLDPGFGWLMRCDRVSFPPGGIAHAHVHQGPGIRCCLEGEIRIESGGTMNRYGAGDAWFEDGREPVLAPTTEAAATSFVRCFLLPRGCKGRSSIRYARSADVAKPKTQRYRVLGERFIALDGSASASRSA
jgi:hypothetical protein